SIAVPMREDEQTLPDEVGMTADGKFGIYSNKTSIFVFATATGQIFGYEQIIKESDFSPENIIESLTYDPVSNRLGLIERQEGRFQVLVYSITEDGQLHFENRIKLPKQEILGFGSN